MNTGPPRRALVQREAPVSVSGNSCSHKALAEWGGRAAIETSARAGSILREAPPTPRRWPHAWRLKKILPPCPRSPPAPCRWKQWLKAMSLDAPSIQSRSHRHGAGGDLIEYQGGLASIQSYSHRRGVGGEPGPARKCLNGGRGYLGTTHSLASASDWYSGMRLHAIACAG